MLISEAVVISLIAAVSSFLAALLGLFNAALTRRNEKHIVETKDAVVTLEKQTNSMKDALVKVTAETEFAKGLKLGVEATKGKEGPTGPTGEQGPAGPQDRRAGAAVNRSTEDVDR